MDWIGECGFERTVDDGGMEGGGLGEGKMDGKRFRFFFCRTLLSRDLLAKVAHASSTFHGWLVQGVTFALMKLIGQRSRTDK